MLLMRHSDPKLTAKAYVDQADLPPAESIDKLPGITNNGENGSGAWDRTKDLVINSHPLFH